MFSYNQLNNLSGSLVSRNYLETCESLHLNELNWKTVMNEKCYLPFEHRVSLYYKFSLLLLWEENKNNYCQMTNIQ